LQPRIAAAFFRAVHPLSKVLTASHSIASGRVLRTGAPFLDKVA
jgi:hypothetical protein